MTDPITTLRALASAFIARYPVPTEHLLTEHLLLEFVAKVQALQREADAQIADSFLNNDLAENPYAVAREIADEIRKQTASERPRADTSDVSLGPQAHDAAKRCQACGLEARRYYEQQLERLKQLESERVGLMQEIRAHASLVQEMEKQVEEWRDEANRNRQMWGLEHRDGGRKMRDDAEYYAYSRVLALLRRA